MPEGALAVGETLGGYRIERLLGAGAMGAVYRAVRLADGTASDIKVLQPALAASDVYLRRFEQEARAALGLEHPHLAGVLEAGADDGRPFLAMRFVDGPSLDDHLAARGPLPLDETLR